MPLGACAATRTGCACPRWMTETKSQTREPNSCRVDSTFLIPGKEHVVLWMSVDPSKENYILSIMHVPHIFKPFHCAGVRLPSLPELGVKIGKHTQLLPGNNQVRYDKSVVPQTPP